MMLQVRSVRSVTAVCSDRAVALATHMTAKQDLDAKKVRQGWQLFNYHIYVCSGLLSSGTT